MADQSSESQSKVERAESIERQLEGEPAPTTPPANPSGGSTPAPGTDDVGESVTRPGEDIAERDGKEPGRADSGTSASGRPKGESDERDASSVTSGESATDSPPMGGQGG